jgi:hypothetical protein
MYVHIKCLQDAIKVGNDVAVVVGNQHAPPGWSRNGMAAVACSTHEPGQANDQFIRRKWREDYVVGMNL